MNNGLNTGKGQCHGTASLLLQPVQAVIELGASDDVLVKILTAVHHANRRGSSNDFIAVALSTMRMGRNRMLPGHDIELIGSEASLSGLTSLDWIQSLLRRGMLKPFEIQETASESGTTGAAYIRDRACEKRTKGWLRRNKARAERHGKTWKDGSVRSHDKTALCLQYGQSVIYVRQIIGEITDEPLMVSTYGFSSPVSGHEAILPVYPEAARVLDHAA